MRSCFNLPSGTYNLVLSKEDLDSLLEKGYVSCQISRTPCVAQRSLWNDDTKDLETIASKEVQNALNFYIDDELADCGHAKWGVQYLIIHTDKKAKGE